MLEIAGKIQVFLKDVEEAANLLSNQKHLGADWTSEGRIRVSDGYDNTEYDMTVQEAQEMIDKVKSPEHQRLMEIKRLVAELETTNRKKYEMHRDLERMIWDCDSKANAIKALKQNIKEKTAEIMGQEGEALKLSERIEQLKAERF